MIFQISVFYLLYIFHSPQNQIYNEKWHKSSHLFPGDYSAVKETDIKSYIDKSKGPSLKCVMEENNT